MPGDLAHEGEPLFPLCLNEMRVLREQLLDLLAEHFLQAPAQVTATEVEAAGDGFVEGGDEEGKQQVAEDEPDHNFQCL